MGATTSRHIAAYCEQGDVTSLQANYWRYKPGSHKDPVTHNRGNALHFVCEGRCPVTVTHCLLDRLHFNQADGNGNGELALEIAAKHGARVHLTALLGEAHAAEEGRKQNLKSAIMKRVGQGNGDTILIQLAEAGKVDLLREVLTTVSALLSLEELHDLIHDPNVNGDTVLDILFARQTPSAAAQILGALPNDRGLYTTDPSAFQEVFEMLEASGDLEHFPRFVQQKISDSELDSLSNTDLDNLDLPQGSKLLNDILSDILRHRRQQPNSRLSLQQPQRWLLLHGPHGTGKTAIAHALANSAGLPFAALNMEGVDGYLGHSRAHVLEALLTAASDLACKPTDNVTPGCAVVVLEHLEAIAGHNSATDAIVDLLHADRWPNLILIATADTIGSLNAQVRRTFAMPMFCLPPNKDSRRRLITLQLSNHRTGVSDVTLLRHLVRETRLMTVPDVIQAATNAASIARARVSADDVSVPATLNWDDVRNALAPLRRLSDDQMRAYVEDACRFHPSVHQWLKDSAALEPPTSRARAMWEEISQWLSEETLEQFFEGFMG
ncbi:hypothetical protein PTSG_07017 [Salpingoeca rosetta]|uniref:AAA+ ATPase domain-containing protein n=1 Tax=Salpingoeca rosetta (strain ATCC 50818 / BSB-021) TaxID=946362 RepID=F2UDT4_SALR5|nr:uncharacterized protein PTSG_07017 [Salpingoeca rosetta]EGD74784.1 hypothetical protein PTSG_07017 [Salpingoeca rosetta]|eukprot:XP_004992429.1 hypothetical protein PTSG_07017 [Salpingoeca rosetta]